MFHARSDAAIRGVPDGERRRLIGKTRHRAPRAQATARKGGPGQSRPGTLRRSRAGLRSRRRRRRPPPRRAARISRSGGSRASRSSPRPRLQPVHGPRAARLSGAARRPNVAGQCASAWARTRALARTLPLPRAVSPARKRRESWAGRRSVQTTDGPPAQPWPGGGRATRPGGAWAAETAALPARRPGGRSGSVEPRGLAGRPRWWGPRRPAGRPRAGGPPGLGGRPRSCGPRRLAGRSRGRGGGPGARPRASHCGGRWERRAETPHPCASKPRHEPGREAGSPGWPTRTAAAGGAPGTFGPDRP